ncbi:OmpH family outer membrane protein [Ferruginibacter albus]|uniref:OmpH family outer membrane protein n=1 Tax=Ferruginibacter albus TaxID=2875540 RepID=UPI001CC61CCD|nr:OmpH family outer membrane protein [Ferruginibacter albus]UAY51840.1 OmpH family outer membrane protein [Ferruginibacter albus]
MKKLFVAGALVLSVFGASAQGKIGYISTEDLISAMPEAADANSKLQDYQSSLQQQGNEYLQELNEKDSLFVRDSIKLSSAAKELRRNDLIALYQKVQNWNQTSQQLLQEKQQTLLAPIRSKALDAIKDAAKDGGYTYVLDAAALIVSPPGDDILPLVKKKLGIKDVPSTKTPVTKPIGQ